MKSLDNVGVTFVNMVVGSGTLNGVVNLSFGVYQFTPSEDSATVDTDVVIASRLRMDRMCALQLRDTLNNLFASVEKAEHETGTHMNGAVTEQTNEKPN